MTDQLKIFAWVDWLNTSSSEDRIQHIWDHTASIATRHHVREQFSVAKQQNKPIESWEK